MSDSIKAIIFTPGDFDAGIPSLQVQADIGLEEFSDADDRKEVREILKQAYGQILNDSVSIHFSDECVGCNEVLPNHRAGCWQIETGEPAQKEV